MSMPDLVFLILIGLLALRGFLKGFTGELFSITSVALALIAAFFLYKNTAAFIRTNYLQMNLVPEILAFSALFLVVFIVCRITGHIVKDIIKRLNLETLDKLLGIFLGLAEGFALVVLVVFIFSNQPVFDVSEFLSGSVFVRFLLPFMGAFHV